MFSSTSLKRLAITSTRTSKDYPKEFQHLMIDMPNLIYLRLEEILRRNIHLVDVSSLETASIFLFSLSFENYHVQCNILSALSNVTRLVLVSASVFEDVVPKVLQHDLPRCETFNSLKHLHLGEWFLSGGCYLLIYLLRRSPDIEKVILQLDKARAELMTMITIRGFQMLMQKLILHAKKQKQCLVVKSLEKSESTAHRVIKEPKSSCASCQPILALSPKLKSSQLRMMIWLW
uniref:FBD domain-containing protein n=1 Tax=Arundo donax TaxID=35708 RepID=A0A0A9ADU6_ARUDO